MRYYLKKEWKLNALTIGFAIAGALCEVLWSLVLMQITENIIDFNLKGFATWLMVDLGVFLLMIIFDQTGTVCKGRAIRNMNNRIRLDMAASLVRSDYRKYHAQESGAYLSQLTNDVNQIENMAWNTFYQGIATVATIVFSITALILLHWSLAIAAVLAAIIMLNAPKMFDKKMETLGADCAEKQASGTGRMKDLLSGFDVLRSFGRVQVFMTGVKEASDRVEEPQYHLTWVKNLVQNGITLVSILVQMVTNCLIGFLSIKGVILQGALMGGGNLCGSVTNGLANLGQFRLAFSAAKPYFEKITAHAEDVSVDREGSAKPLSDAITVQDLSFQYGEKPILEKASFRFEKGGKYALTGPSGCGKSTLLKLLLGWLPEYSGTIRFDDTDAQTVAPEQLQRQMSYIEQNVFLFNTTIRDNITLGREFSDEAMEKALRDSALLEDLAGMPEGLDTVVGEEGSCLSGGQKQRVAIARALIHDRSILLVEEGTSALDQKNADIVEKSLLNNPELTLILVSHHLTEERKRQFTQVYELEPVAV